MSAFRCKADMPSCTSCASTYAAVLRYRVPILSLKIFLVAWRISHCPLGLSINCQREGDLARLSSAARSIREEARVVMHKTPKDIARSLRAFRNAHRLGLLRCVRISPGEHACEAARAQDRMEYLGNAVPSLPLAQCARSPCECDYLPVGSEKLKQLNANRRPKTIRTTERRGDE